MIPVCSTLISYLSFHVNEDRTGWSHLVILMSVRPGEDMRAEKMSSVVMSHEPTAPGLEVAVTLKSDPVTRG